MKNFSLKLLIILAAAAVLASCTKYNPHCKESHKRKEWINKLQYQ